MQVKDRRLVATDADVVQLALAAPDGREAARMARGGPHRPPLPSGRTRQYSLCGDPRQEREYQVAVRRIPDGGGGSVEVHGLTVGQTVEISEPRNAFMMPLPGSGSRAQKLRFIAGGIGITPILPMARLAERLGVPWSMCYTGRHRKSLPFLDELLAFGDKVTVRTDDEHGLPSAAELLDGVDERTAVYVCGPPPMIEAVRRNIPLDGGTELHIERFSPLPVVDGTPFELELARSAEVVAVGGDQSALAALRAARPNVSYSCQQGFCGTCVQRVLAGEVEHRDTTLTDAATGGRSDAGLRLPGQVRGGPAGVGPLRPRQPNLRSRGSRSCSNSSRNRRWSWPGAWNTRWFSPYRRTAPTFSTASSGSDATIQRLATCSIGRASAAFSISIGSWMLVLLLGGQRQRRPEPGVLQRQLRGRCRRRS